MESDPVSEDLAKEVEEPQLEFSLVCDEPANEVPAAPMEVDASEIATGAALGVIGMIAANLDNDKITDKDIVEEPKELAPTSPKSDRDKRSSKHRSSRHSTHTSRHHSSREKDSLTDDSHHRRRDSGNSFKALFTPTSPKKSDRRDSGYSQGSGGSHRKQRTPEEQEAHEKRKAEHRAAKAKESESAAVDGPARPEASRRISSRQHSTSHSSKEDRRPKMLKGESIVESPFIAKKDEPHIKEEVKEVKKPIMERSRFSVGGETPNSAARNEKGRAHSHRDRGARHNRERKTDDRHNKERDEKDKDKVEQEREARRVRKEAENEMEVAREEVSESERRQKEKDDEERRIRREERRKRREAEEIAAGEGRGKEQERDRVRKPRSDASKDGEREREVKPLRKPRSDASKGGERAERHRERYREHEMLKEDKSPLKSLWSSAKKVFG